MLVSDLAHGCLASRWSRRLDVSMRTSYSGARCQGRRLDVSMRTSSPRIPGSPHINTSHITHPHHTPRSTDHKSHTRHHKHIKHLTPQHTSNTLGHNLAGHSRGRREHAHFLLRGTVPCGSAHARVRSRIRMSGVPRWSRRLDVSMRPSYSGSPFRAEVPMLVSDLAHGFGVPRWSRRLDVSMRTSYSAAPCRAEVPMLVSDLAHG